MKMPNSQSPIPNPQSPKFHFGSENHLLETIIEQILNRSQGSTANLWNPTTFYGPGGCGKTFLLNEIHRLWKQNRPSAKTLALTAAEFARAFAVAVETNTTDEFQKRLRETEFWTLDQLEDMQSKTAALEELKQILDDATALGNTVLFATRRSPDELNRFPEPLLTRIVGGLTIPIQPASPQTRTAMIREIAAKFHITLSEEAASELVQILDLPYPKIQGIFSQITLESEKQPPEIGFVREFFKRYEKRTQPTLEEILKFTAKQLSLRQSEIRGKSRSARIAQGRAIAIFLARRETEHTLKEIGRFFGGRDHKTVSHYCEETEKKLSTDNELRHIVAKIRETLAAQTR